MDRKKVQKAKGLLRKHAPSVSVSEQPTRSLFVGNSGAVCGMDFEELEPLLEKYGEVESLYSLPNKPFTFATYRRLEEAVKAFHGLNIDKTRTPPLYLVFVTEVPKAENFCAIREIPGLDLIENFISEEQEAELWSDIQARREEAGVLKNREVFHYGHDFIYGQNKINIAEIGEKIPGKWGHLLDSVTYTASLSLKPDQITINIYHPGQGIPLHTDTHSTCDDYVCSLSLLNDVIMDLLNEKTGHRIPILLPRRSLLVLRKEARYVWKHGISMRKYDCGPDGKVRKRGVRCSLTFRAARFQPCACEFPEFCDDLDRKGGLEIPNAKSEAVSVEKKYVAEVYNSISEHFDSTRHSLWPGVRSFLDSLVPGSFLLDVGCGNGKYLFDQPQIFKVGCDLSEELAGISGKKGHNALVSSCLSLPVADSFFDAAISIAVFHHLSTEERRRVAIEELGRVTRSGGRILIYVWAMEQKLNSESSSYLDGKKAPLCEAESHRLRVHLNRTEFTQQDLLVPWDLQSKSGENQRFLRYYHVFRQHELDRICESIPGLSLLKSYYEQGNWCVLLRKE